MLPAIKSKLILLESLPDLLDGVDNALGVAMGGIDDEDVDACLIKASARSR